MNLRHPNEIRESSADQDSNSNPALRFVDADEFCSLAVSSKNLRRSDDAGTALRGLLEVETGVRYVIEEHRLFEYCRLKSGHSDIR